MKILFITATRIGDAVLSTGVVADFAARYPDARFTIACGVPPAYGKVVAELRFTRAYGCHGQGAGNVFFGVDGSILQQ